MSPAPRRLESLVESVRAHLRRGALFAAGLWVITVVAWILVAAWLLTGPSGWRQGSNVPLVLDALILAAAAFGHVAVRRGAPRWFSEAPLARAIERAGGVRDGEVRGSLELARHTPSGVSVRLAERAAERTLSELSRPPAELTGSLGGAVRSWRRRASGVLAVTAVLLAVLVVASPARTGRALRGLSAPLSTAANPVLAPLVLTPGTVEVPRGSDVEIRLEAPGRTTADLSWQAAGDVSRTESLTLNGGVALKRFEAVTAAVEYSARTRDGASTEVFRIVPVDPLFVSDLRLEISYPPHTGIEPEEYRGTVPALRLPVGTRLAVEGSASRALSHAALVDEGGEAAFAPKLDGVHFQGDWRPSSSGRYAWEFLDDRGQPAEVQPEPWDIVLLPDSVPGVSIPLPGADTLMPLTLKQPLVLEAHDDYGLRRLELVAYRVTATGESREPVTQGLDLGGTRAALARPLLDLSGWGLLPGDQVRYFARATDNAPQGQTSQTREFVLRMPLAAELRRDAEEKLGDMAKRLDDLAKEADQKAEETRDLQRQKAAEESPTQAGKPGGDPKELGFEDKQELKKALDDQKALTSKVDSMRAELAALEETMKNAGEADPNLSADLKELQELLQQVASEEMKDQLDKMAEGLDKEDMQKSAEQLQELAKQQEKFRDQLEQSLDRFRRAAVDQDFRATQSEADDLAKQEKALSDAMKEGDKPELRAEQQKKLGERTDELTSRMDKLQERLKQLGEKDASQEVTKAHEQADEARQQMADAQQKAEQTQQSGKQDPQAQKQQAQQQQAKPKQPGQQQQGEKQKSQPNPQQDAGKKAEDAAKTMEKAADQLDKAQQQMQQQKAEALQGALERAADDALSLARRQNEIRERMGEASQDQVTEMRADEASLLQGVKNLAQNLQTQTEGASNGTPELAEQIGRAMESMARTVQAMEGRRGSVASPEAAADRTIDELNQLALTAMAGAQQMSQQGDGQSGQQKSEQTAEQLEQLAQQQGEVSNQTSQLTPMQLGEQALKEQLQRLAQQQQSVAQDLDQLKEKKGAEQQSLGSLQELAKEAQELAKQMAEGRMTPDLQKRQDQLFHRLLDAGRSLQKEDEDTSDERESKTPGAFERAEVVPLSADRMGALRYQMPDAERLQQLPPAVRQLVIQYFERLNRGSASPPPVGKDGGGHPPEGGR